MERHRIVHSLALSAWQTYSRQCRKALSILPVLGCFIISGFPVLHGCESTQIQDSDFTEAERSVSVKVAVHNSEEEERFDTMDLLVFNDDRLQRLDCYCRESLIENNEVEISSQTGRKLLMACVNTQYSPEDWLWVRSTAGLEDFKADIEYETRDCPVMSSISRFDAGGSVVTQQLHMSRISSEIVLRSVSCNFKGRPYEGEKLKNVMVYLTNVNATCPIWSGNSYPERFINQGRYCMEDMDRMKEPGLLHAQVTGEIGTDRYTTDLHFRCYPNLSSEEGPGSVFTRLVIQGDIAGKTWYWPFDINRGMGNSHEGIGRNMQYIHDIVITRKGAADPDTAISTREMTIDMSIREWTEKEEYQVRF